MNRPPLRLIYRAPSLPLMLTGSSNEPNSCSVLPPSSMNAPRICPQDLSRPLPDSDSWQPIPQRIPTTIHQTPSVAVAAAAQMLCQQLYQRERARVTQRGVAPAKPDLIAGLNARLEYVGFYASHPGVALGPVDGRLGRHVSDILPTDLVDLYDRTIHRATRDQRPAMFTYTAADGRFFTGQISAESPDNILVLVHQIA